MNKMYEIEGVEQGSKLLVCETSDRTAIRLVVEADGVVVAVLLDVDGKMDLFDLADGLDVVRLHAISDEEGT